MLIYPHTTIKILANIQLLVLIEIAAKTVTLIAMNSVSDIDCINPLKANNTSAYHLVKDEW